MSFASYEFILLFLPVTVLLFWAAQRMSVSIALWLLCFASLVFYIYWNPRDVLVAGASIAFNYQAAKVIIQGGTRGKLMFSVAVTGNLFALGYFKYLGFAVELLAMAYGDNQVNIPAIVLPLGISFFTFTQIAYLADCYAGKIPTGKHNPRDYLLFVSFFPHLIAGPILHHADIIPQFHARFRESRKLKMRAGMVMFTIGLVKKVLIADHFARIANPVFLAADTGELVPSADAWSGALAYTFQLYFDFSGYSDMAVGTALLVGMHIPFNFFSPYRATSIIEFWRRWHITLSAFLRDYLYIPLGGNRRGTPRRYVNVFITMLLGGVWHGAGVNFVIWGALHGGFIVINHAWRDFVVARIGTGSDSLLLRIMAYLLTMGCVVVGWVFFRAHTTGGAIAMLKSMAMLPGLSYTFLSSVFTPNGAAIVFGIALVTGFPNSRQIHDWMFERGFATPWVPMGIACGMAMAMSLIFISADSPFLYFQF